MSAVRREQPARLPSDRGLVGALITDASTEQLQACLRQDQLWLHGGTATDEDGARYETTGFLGNASQNPGKWETAEEYLAHTRETSANHRAVRRVALRIGAIEDELAKRVEQQHDESTRRREQANSKLVAWRANAPKVVADFQAAAAQAAKDWVLVAPIAAALLRLQEMFPSAQRDIRAAYARLQTHDREIDECVDPLNGNYKPPPDLPPGLPSFEQVRDCANVFNTSLEWPDSRVPTTGLEKIAVERVLREARGEF